MTPLTLSIVLLIVALAVHKIVYIEAVDEKVYEFKRWWNHRHDKTDDDTETVTIPQQYLE